ncbi:RidA family protein [Aerococcaceae bacterium DSM 111020]|nr:RidA family protein [Aerococcaceae bacterium DSM 111020]
MQSFESNKAPQAVGPYSQAVRTGDLLYLSGQLGIDRQTGELVDGIEAQTRQAFRNISYVLEEAGLEMKDIVKLLVLLTDINDFGLVNEVYAEQFSEPYPARSAFAVKDLPLGGVVEIEVIASYAK